MLVLISHRSCRVGDSFTKVSLKENSTSRWVRCPSRRTYCRYGNHTPVWRSVSENDSAFPGVRDVLAPRPCRPQAHSWENASGTFL